MSMRKLTGDAFAAGRRRILRHWAGLLLGLAVPLTSRPARAEPAPTAPITPGSSGRVVDRAAPDYEIQRQSLMWQPLKSDRKPDRIVQVASAQDVVSAIRYARGHGLKVAVRGGGHSWCHSAIRDGGMLLDLGRLRAVDIDAARRVARVEPAVTGRDLAATLDPHGLAFPVPHCGTVPMSGFLLGGGLPWNGESWGGMACFSVEAAEIVTAQGELITADATHHPDWFWAVRGAGPGFFGVVTRYHLRLYPLPRAIMTSTYTWPLARMGEVLRWWTDVASRLAPQVEIIFLLATLPDARFPDCDAPTGAQVCIVSATVFADTEAQARSQLAPLAAGPVPEACVKREEYAPSPYSVLFDWDDASFPRERMVADTLWSNAPPVEVFAPVQAHFQQVPSPGSSIICQLRPHPLTYPDAAYSLRAPTYVAAYANWKRQQDDALNTRWLREAMRLMEPKAIGHYVNESDLEANPARARGSFAPRNWERLQALRAQYDPERLFHTFFGLE